MKDVSYKSFIKKKCDCCGDTDDLTVHHVVGREFHKYLKQYTVLPKDLKTLCNDCHQAVEEEIDVIKASIPVSPYYERIVRVNSRVSTAVDLETKTGKTKQELKFLESVKDMLALKYENNDFDLTTVEIILPDKWPTLYKADHDHFCRMLRDHYKLFKLKRRTFHGISTKDN